MLRVRAPGGVDLLPEVLVVQAGDRAEAYVAEPADQLHDELGASHCPEGQDDLVPADHAGR
eukprot:465903-Rhodomonas_salina.1